MRYEDKEADDPDNCSESSAEPIASIVVAAKI
jgi:hypothetical protein